MAPFVLAVALCVLGCGRVQFDVLSDADSIGLVDASLLSDAWIAPDCTGTAVVDDEFDDGMPAPSWMINPSGGIVISETGGLLEFAFADAVNPDRYAMYQSTMLLTVANGFCITAYIAERPVDEGSLFLKCTGNADQIEIYGLRDTGIPRQHHSGLITGADPFDDRAVYRWRLRQQGNVTGWDFGYDGGPMYVAAELTDVWSTSTTCRPEVGAGSATGAMNAGFGRYERVVIQVP